MAKRDPLIGQAQDETTVRYQPQIDALKFLFDQAKSNYLTGRSQADSAARSIIAAAQQAQGPLLEGYKSILGNTQAATHQFQADVGRLMPTAAGSRLAAGTNEAQLAAQNLGLSAQAGLTMLAHAQVRAAEGAKLQGAQLGNQFRQDAQKIGQQQQSIASQAGTFSSLALDQLHQQRADRHVKYAQIRAENKRASSSADDQYLRKFGLSRDQYLALPPEQRQALITTSTPPSRADRRAQRDRHDQIAATVTQANTLIAAGRDVNEVKDLLINGRPAQTVPNPQYNPPDPKADPAGARRYNVPRTIQIPEIKPVPQSVVDAAFQHIHKRPTAIRKGVGNQIIQSAPKMHPLKP